MKKFTSKKQAPGLRADGHANRALTRAYLKGKPWAVQAVQAAANDMGRAAVALAAAFGGVLSANDDDLSPSGDSDEAAS